MEGKKEMILKTWCGSYIDTKNYTFLNKFFIVYKLILGHLRSLF